jgi:HD-like signal output (HDOD) protein
MPTDVALNSNSCLKRIQVYIARMPSLSTTVSKVLETCNNPNASPNDLNRVISLDPVLTGQVLKLINSAYYALSQPITSLPRAIIMLGLNTVKNLALSLAILETMGVKGPLKSISAIDFWAHCLCVGVAAKCMSEIKGAPRNHCEDAFIAGLLHDLGKIPLTRQFPDMYLKALKLADDDRLVLIDAENAVFGIDHGVVGRLIAEKWQLGKMLTESLARHHSPEELNSDQRSFAATIAAANSFANLWQIGFAGDRIGDNSQIAEFLSMAGLRALALDDLRDLVSVEIEKAKIYLEISRRG